MEIRRLPKAVADVDEIWAHISADNPAAADRLVEQFTAAAARLADFPESAQQYADLAPNARGIPVGKYLIFYRVMDDCVEIVRVIHGARDRSQFTADFT